MSILFCCFDSFSYYRLKDDFFELNYVQKYQPLAIPKDRALPS